MTFYIKRNDTAPPFRAILKDGDGDIVNVTGATVRFHMNKRDGTAVVNAAATINSATAGDVEYNWDAADTALAGIYNAEFEVTYANTTVETFPNKGYEEVRVTEDLA